MGLRLFPRIVGVAAALAFCGAAWVNPPDSAPPPEPAPSAQPAPAAAAQQAPLEVSDWALNGSRLTVLLHGNMAAVDRLRTQGRLAIEVHWARQSAGGAPDLVTELPVGEPGLAPALAGEVERQGYFAWHSWAQKRLGPGAWSVTLTWPDGSPVMCAPQEQPCRLSFNAG